MNEKLCFSDRVDHNINSKGGFSDRFDPRGTFHCEFWRPSWNAKFSPDQDFPNGIVTVGKAVLLTSFFANVAPPATWYIGTVDSSGFTAFAAGDVLASHTGWNEANYSGSRQTWGTASTAIATISNASPATFTMTGSGTLYGIFVCTAVSGTSGTLWSEAAFSNTVAVNSGDQVKVTYTINC